MKIRLDHVSNSSSSSCIVSRKPEHDIELSDWERFTYRSLRPLGKDEIISGLQWYSGSPDGKVIKAETISCDGNLYPKTKSITYYSVAEDVEEFISWMMGVSLSYNIVNLLNVPAEFSVTIAPSGSGDTNIDDDIVEQFLVRLGCEKDYCQKKGAE